MRSFNYILLMGIFILTVVVANRAISQEVEFDYTTNDENWSEPELLNVIVNEEVE